MKCLENDASCDNIDDAASTTVGYKVFIIGFGGLLLLLAASELTWFLVFRGSEEVKHQAKLEFDKVASRNAEIATHSLQLSSELDIMSLDEEMSTDKGSSSGKNAQRQRHRHLANGAVLYPSRYQENNQIPLPKVHKSSLHQKWCKAVRIGVANRDNGTNRVRRGPKQTPASTKHQS